MPQSVGGFEKRVFMYIDGLESVIRSIIKSRIKAICNFRDGFESRRERKEVSLGKFKKAGDRSGHCPGEFVKPAIYKDSEKR